MQVFFFPVRRDLRVILAGWNTKISARDSNYGTRIDLVLVTPGLLPWIKSGDIMPSLKGSDHCPTYIDLHDHIEMAGRGSVTLSEVMHFQANTEPPRLAAKFWEELKGRQTLHTFFAGSKPLQEANSGSFTTAHPSEVGDKSKSPTLAEVQSPVSNVILPSGCPPLSTIAKRKIRADQDSPGMKKPKAGQAKLSFFFANPTTLDVEYSPSVQPEIETLVDHFESDHLLALQLSQEDVTSQTPSSSKERGKSTKQVWANMLAPIPPPCCVVHNEPGKELTVTKTGPNKGKRFFICSRYCLCST